MSKTITYACAESITGGRLQAHFTKMNGSSAYFRGGITAYATDVKVSTLRVNERIAIENNSVCEQVAKEMAEGCYKLFNADVCVATTGYVQGFEWSGEKYEPIMHVAIRLSENITGSEPVIIHESFNLHRNTSRKDNLISATEISLRLINDSLAKFKLSDPNLNFK